MNDCKLYVRHIIYELLTMFCALQPENHQLFRLGPLFQALESKHIGAGGMSNYVLLSNLKMVDSDHMFYYVLFCII